MCSPATQGLRVFFFFFFWASALSGSWRKDDLYESMAPGTVPISGFPTPRARPTSAGTLPAPHTRPLGAVRFSGGSACHAPLYLGVSFLERSLLGWLKKGSRKETVGSQTNAILGGLPLLEKHSNGSCGLVLKSGNPQNGGCSFGFPSTCSKKVLSRKPWAKDRARIM